MADGLLNKASIILTPTGYKAGTLYNVAPIDEPYEDFDFARTSTATRINSSGLVSNVATGVPRINYDSNGENGHILLEPTSTNLVTYSQQFGGSTDYFDNYNQANEVSDNNLAPDGTNTATQIVSTGAGKLQTSNYISLPANTTYTLSFFAKNVDATEVKSRILANGGSGGSNLTSVSYVSQINTSTWTRITHTFTTNSTSQAYILYLSNALNSGGNIQLWGAQLEELPYATSYIPTLTGSTETRATETATGAGSADLINSTEGVLYAEISSFKNGGIGDRTISISDGSTQNAIQLFLHNTANRINFRLRSGGSLDVNISDFTFEQNQINKIACKYKSGDYALWINGEERATSTSSSLPSELSVLAFNDGSLYDFYGKVKAIRVYKEASSDTDLQNLTS